jgi:cytochrome c oxidase assembly protein subunit 15
MAGALPPNLQLRKDRQLRQSLALLASHLVVALVALVAIGGATRVMEAGLACPDWPLCYGRFLPGQQMNFQVFLEWLHRLDSFVVGMALLVFVGVGVALRRRLPTWLPWMAALALGLVAFQGALGALTVTHLLASPLVTAHLATALVLVSLVSGIYQRLAMVPEVMGPQVMGPQVSNQSPAVPRWWQALAVLALTGAVAYAGYLWLVRRKDVTDSIAFLRARAQRQRLPGRMGCGPCPAGRRRRGGVPAHHRRGAGGG